MNIQKLSKKPLNLLAAAAIIVCFSSCNRGYGCPTNFSISDFFQDLCVALIGLFF
jgi:hypothetical protein